MIHIWPGEDNFKRSGRHVGMSYTTLSLSLCMLEIFYWKTNYMVLTAVVFSPFFFLAGVRKDWSNLESTWWGQQGHPTSLGPWTTSWRRACPPALESDWTRSWFLTQLSHSLLQPQCSLYNSSSLFTYVVFQNGLFHSDRQYHLACLHRPFTFLWISYRSAQR